MANLRTTTMKRYEVNNPWARVIHRAECSDCGQAFESADSMGKAMHEALNHVCR